MTGTKHPLLRNLLKPSRWLERGPLPNRRRARELARRREWREFTLLLGGAFMGQGYAVRQLAGERPGMESSELVLKKQGRHYLVECGHWRESAVDDDAVRELVGRMLTLRCAGAFLVTSGYFTAEAADYAEGRNVVLIEGPQLRHMLRRAARS